MLVVLYQWRRVTDRLKPALIVRQFAAEYALLQASGSLLRYRFYWRERNFAILDLFLPPRGRARKSRIRFSAYYITLYRAHFPDTKLLSLSLSLSFSPMPCRPGHMSGIRVRHASRDVVVPAMMSGSILWAQCESTTVTPVSHYRADEKIGLEFS